MRSHTGFLKRLSLFALAGIIFSVPATAQNDGFSDPGSRQGGASASGGLAPVVPSVDGGPIPIGATAQVVVRFVNQGSQPVETGLIRLYPSSTISANIAMNQCEEEPLQPSAECAIALSVKALQAGAWRVEMLMSHSGRSRLVTATLSGQVEATGESASMLSSDIETIPSEVDFETLNDSQTLVKPVILRNITSTALDITDIYIDTSDQAGYSLKSDCKKLEAGQACIAVVSWSPKVRGRSSGVLVVHHSGPTALSSVPLMGEYTPEDVEEAEIFPQAVPGRGLMVSSLLELNFGPSVATASTVTVSLVNSGDAQMTIRDIRISGSDNGLSFKDDGCSKGAVLQPLEACPLTLAWSPTRVGPLYDDVQILHDGARGVLVLPVRGEAIGTVSQDQKAILLAGASATEVIGTSASPIFIPGTEDPSDPGSMSSGNIAPVSYTPSYATGVVNPSGVLDGYKITSFSKDRAIINGPGGSRLIFDREEIVLGGLPWFIMIKKEGIEFLHQEYRVLLLFDRSLSSINRVSASSTEGGSSVGSSQPSEAGGAGAEGAADGG
jgi:hypothetical protein